LLANHNHVWPSLLLVGSVTRASYS
jgi:hypothetical protein